MSLYQYSALLPNTIRVLVICPGANNTPISCTFLIINLPSTQKYKALSYVWGAPSFTEHITVDSQDHFITPSLHRALKMIRSETEEQIIWADQLCINQSDIQERSSQVAIMSLIYTEAEMVHVILEGTEEAAGERAANLVNGMAVKIEQESENYGSISDIPALELEELKFYESLDWSALKTMLLDTWFFRAWVVQEVGLARKAIFGYAGSEIQWDSLMLLLDWLSGAAGRPIRRKHRLKGWTVHHIWVSYSPEARKTTNFPHYSFIDVLGHCACTFSATNPRDHIYAFLGHPSYTEVGGSLIQPNYEWSVSKVYVDFAKRWIQRTEQAHLFSCVDHKTLPRDLTSTKLQLEFPSWCPRWNSLENGGSRLDTGLEYTWYRAARDSNFQFRELEDPRNIKVGGFIFDVIEEGFEYVEESGAIKNPSLQLQMFEVYLRLLRHVDRGTLNHVYESTLEAFASTCTAGFTDDDHGINCLAYMNTLHEQHIPFEDLPQSSGNPDEFDDLSAETTMARRRFFITCQGYFGIGPKVLAEGDLCCILFGARVPYILRPLDDSTYLLVGECYVQGIMLGEAFDMYLKTQKFEEHQFVLR